MANQYGKQRATHLKRKHTTMTSHEILNADVLDILFDNRNKMYGAYELRKRYNNRLGFALGIMLALLLLAIVLLNNLSDNKPVLPVPDIDNDVTTIDIKPIEPEVEKPVAPRTPPPAAAQSNFVDRIELVKEATDLPDQSVLETSIISNQNVEGPEFTDAHQPPVAEVVNEPVVAKEEPKPLVSVEKNAEFPGGQAAWIAFLSKYLRTPDELEAGQKKTVYVRFVVDVDGSISKFEIAHSGGAAFDNEVIRVLKKMPKWTPAFQNGHNVSVIFTQPVTFMALEE